MNPHTRQTLKTKEIRAFTSIEAAEFDDEFKYSFVLSERAKDKADNYFLLHYSTEKVRGAISHQGEVIQKGKIIYVVQWVNAQQKRIILSGTENNRVALSFRRRAGSFIGYVIPKIMYGEAPPLDNAAGA